MNIRSAANGDADVNKRFGAILLIVAPGEKPTNAAIATVKGVLADFHKRYPEGRLRPYGHKDVRAAGTDCPGPITYGLIQNGVLTPTTTPPPGDNPTPPTGDWFDMATPEQIEEAVYMGTLRAHRQYGKELFTEGNTADKIWDEARASQASTRDLLTEIAGNTKPPTVNLEG